MTHLGQRLSAMIDGELDGADRDRVLVHLARCEPCRCEAIALRMLKRRMNALGEAAADSTLTFRLMSLLADGSIPATPWSSLAIAAHAPGRGGYELRPGWYVAAGSVGVFLAGLAAAAFMAGGPQQLPAPRVTPAVDLYMVQHAIDNGIVPATHPPFSNPVGQSAAPHPP